MLTEALPLTNAFAALGQDNEYLSFRRPDVAPHIGTNIMMLMREGIANAMRASRHPIPDNV